MRSPGDHPALLPWHVTGALDPDHAGAIEDHLAWCAPCAREARALASLRKSLVRQGLTDHPSPEALCSMVAGAAMAPGRRGPVEAHVSDCRECREDLDTIRRAGRAQRAIEAGAAARPVPRRAGASGRIRWGLRAAAVLALAIPAAAALWGRGFAPPVEATGSVVLAPAVRGADRDQALGGDGPWSIKIVLPVDAPAGVYLFSVGESAGVRRAAEGSAIADGEGMLRIRLDPLPPGAGYVLRVWPAGSAGSETHEYPFRVTDATAGGGDAWSALMRLLGGRRAEP